MQLPGLSPTLACWGGLLGSYDDAVIEESGMRPDSMPSGNGPRHSLS